MCTECNKLRGFMLSPTFRPNNYLNNCWIKRFKNNIALTIE